MRAWNVIPVLLAASLVLGGQARADLEVLSIPEPSAGMRAYARGLLAALEDADDEVVGWALLSLASGDLNSGFLNEERFPGVRERLVDFLRTPRAAQALRAREGTLHKALLVTQANLGEGSPDTARALVGLLGVERDQQLRFVEQMALVNMGEAAREQIPRLVEMMKLKGGDFGDISFSATFVLRRLGGALPEEVLREMGPLLEDPAPLVRSNALDVLGSMGKAARPLRPRLLELLRDPDSLVRLSAKAALERMRETPWERQEAEVERERASRERADRALKVRMEALEREHPESFESTKQVERQRWESRVRAWTTLTVLRLRDPDSRVRAQALHTWVDQSERIPEFLGEEHTKRLIPLAAELLADPDGKLRAAAARALGRMGAQEYIPRLAMLLQDPDPDARGLAVQALGNLGAREYASSLIPLVHKRSVFVYGSDSIEWNALVDMSPLKPRDVALLVTVQSDNPAERSLWLARAHGLGGGEPLAERALRWLGRRDSAQLPSAEELTPEEARATLRDFATLWPQAEQFPVLADELAQRIAQVTMLGRGQWQASDRALLKQHEKNLRGSQPQHAASVRAALDSIPRRWPRTVAWSWGAHAGFWLLLVLIYPRSTKVQAVFFWNPWVRRLLGLGYVGVLLTWVPFLRRRLLAPFQRLLVADADLGRFSPEAYFERSEVRMVATGQREPLPRAIPRVRGLVVLEGASGLGKSMFIRYLLSTSKQLAVYLPAERCKGGVLEAIQAKLEGMAGDSGFLQSIIYSGALDLYVDGLNEVSADTRSRIVGFVEPRFHGNILLATQRMEWTPPATARVYELQPLTEEQVRDFLFSREPLLTERARLRGEAYRKACEHFLTLALTPEQPEELRREMLEVLSNPMDLTLVAQMLAEGHAPDLFHLQQQQYELMARDYQEKNLTEFPLKTFSEEAYQMRLQVRSAIPEKDFGKELLRMEAHKMVVRRQWRRPDGEEGREWHFRHDKLWDFFIAQTFLGKDNERILEHQDDPRFRGVYFLLAKLLEPEVALEVQDHLVEHAAETRDHTVSDEFVTRLQDRWRAEQARPPTP
ncbi:HEAT repeat domain-containing protein [Archangium violaceum]|uniref:HEAT repeat domain-containing protein n=1 Tax=Archangium violaceum TaxID=83451 RepID=UPI0036DA259D